MKFGIRKPNYAARFKARTTGKWKKKLKRAVNPFYGKKGVGFIKNPGKSIKSAIYHRTTVGVPDALAFAASSVSSGGRHAADRRGASIPSPQQPRNPYTQPAGNPYANPAPKHGRGGHYTPPPAPGGKPKRKVPVWVWIIVGVLVIGMIGSIFAPKSNGGISELELHYTVDDSYSLKVGESVEDYLTVSGKDNFPVDSIEFISSNPSAVEFAFVNAADENVYFRIEAVSPGAATLYVQTTDGVIKSDEIAVSVEPSPTPEPTSTPEPTPSPTPEPTATPEPTEEPEPTADPAAATGQAEEPEPQGEMVWVTEYGSKYHSIPDCGNSSNVRQIALEQAIARGLEPCSNCW